MSRIARKCLLISLFLSIAAVVVILCCLSPRTYQNQLQISFNNLLLHFLFNSLVIVIAAKEHYRNPSDEFDKGFPFPWFSYEMEHGGKTNNDDDCDYIDDLEAGAQYQGNDDCHDDDEDDDDFYHGSDGYDEDNDDDGSYGEMGWDDDDDNDNDDEYDSELERKVEAFIAKVINGWREEWLSDNIQKDQCLF